MQEAEVYLKKVLIILIVFVCGSLKLNSQTIEDSIDPGFRNVSLWIDETSNITGSPYLVEEWSRGAVKTRLGTKFDDLNLKYSNYSDQLFFLGGGMVQKVLERNKVDWFEFYDNKNKRYYFENIAGIGYIQVLQTYSTTKLGKVSEKTVKKGQKNDGYNAGLNKDQFITKVFYYVINNDSREYLKFTTKKEFIKLVTKNKSEIENFIKSEKIKFNKENDLIKLAEYCDTLLF